MSSSWWDWGWGWAATAGAVLLLGIFLIPWFFFLLNLSGLLERVREEDRAMPASYVWLNFVPVFCLGWFLYTVVKVRDSLRAHYETSGWAPEGDFGYNVGITAGVLGIASFFFWWIPFIGWLLVLGWLVCWIMYWLKTSDLKKRLSEGTGWRGGRPPLQYYPPAPPYGGPAPYAPPMRPSVPSAGPAPSVGTAPGAAPQPGAGTPGAGTPGAGTPGAAPAGGDEGAPSRLCMACGTPYDQGDKYCRSCGLPLP